MTCDIFKFPYDASRRVHSRKQRRSKNGTPEERAERAAADAAKMPLASVVDLSGVEALTPAAAIGDDPIFAMIATHKTLNADWQRLYDQLDEADSTAAEEHGWRPLELIRWRNYDIGASEIDTRRETLLEAGEVDTATIEQEYIDAKARYKAQVEAGIAWDKRTGLETLRKVVDRGVAADMRYARRLASTMPTTAAGVAALIQYILDNDLAAEKDYWHMTALKTAVAALNSMGAAAKS
jgi:hypothetical protein